MAVTVKVEVMTGGATTVTAKLPVAVFPVREFFALNVNVKDPLMFDAGERVMMPVSSSIKAQLGAEMGSYVSAPLLLRIWWVRGVAPAFMVSVVALVICPTPPESLPRTKVSPEETYWPRSMSVSLVERLKEDVY